MPRNGRRLRRYLGGLSAAALVAVASACASIVGLGEISGVADSGGQDSGGEAATAGGSSSSGGSLVRRGARRAEATPVRREPRRAGVTPARQEAHRAAVTPVRQEPRRAGLTPVRQEAHRAGAMPVTLETAWMRTATDPRVVRAIRHHRTATRALASPEAAYTAPSRQAAHARAALATPQGTASPVGGYAPHLRTHIAISLRALATVARACTRRRVPPARAATGPRAFRDPATAPECAFERRDAPWAPSRDARPD